MHALTFRQAFDKYRADQARGKDGRWIREGDSSVGSRRAEARRKQQQLADRREARRKRERAARERERAEKPQEPPRMFRLVEKPGGEKAASAIKSALGLMPREHFDKVAERTRFVALPDFNMLEGLLSHGREGLKGTTQAFYMPLLRTVFMPSLVNGLAPADPIAYALHESAHALDHSLGNISEKQPLSDLLLGEYNALPLVQKWYSEHYKSEVVTKELFAEVYTATYHTRSNSLGFMGVLTAAGVRQFFPKSVAYIKSMKV